MLQKMFSFAGVLVLAVAAIVATPRPGQAQHGGGHGGGGHGGGGFHAGGGGSHAGGYIGGYNAGHVGGNHGGYYHGGYDHHGYAPSLGYRPYRNHHYYGGYYPYYNYNPSLYGDSLDNAYGADALLQTDGVVDNSGYRGLSPEAERAFAQAAAANNASMPAPIETMAHVIVRVPAEAEIWVEGTKTTSTGPIREFESPPLTPGSPYTYDIKATWNENGHDVTQTQRFDVTAGAHINLAFPLPPKTEAKKG
jgi:uncharacterized protein (TIGR03000 family)